LIVVDRHIVRGGKPDESKFHVLDADKNYKSVTSYEINNPSGVAIAPNGQIYIYNEGIQIYDLDTSNGKCIKKPEIGKDKSCSADKCTGTTTGGIAFDMLGNIVVSNNIHGMSTNNSSIRIISPDGDKLLGTFVCKRKDAKTLCFSSPDNIAFDKDCKHLFVSGQHHVLVFDYALMKNYDKEKEKPKTNKQIAPMISSITLDLFNPQGIALSNHGEIYVCDHTTKDLANQIKIVSFDQSSSA
jgi:sugar lactone lactonase YvrE